MAPLSLSEQAIKRESSLRIYTIYTLRNCCGSAIIVMQRVFCVYGETAMDCKTKIKELREMTGMNRNEF